MVDAHDAGDSASTSPLTPRVQRLLIAIVYIMPLLWAADHLWLRKKVADGKQELSEVELKKEQLQARIVKLNSLATLVSRPDVTHLVNLKNAGASISAGSTSIFIDALEKPYDEITRDLARIHDLERITIRSPGLSAASLKPLAQIKSLRFVFLGGDCLAGADAELIEMLKVAPNIESIEFADATLSDDVYRQIAATKTLKLVSLRGSAVEDQHIEMLANCTQLEILYLHGTQVTDSSVPFLRQLTSLTELTLPASVSDAARTQLSESLPTCIGIVKGRKP
jgi:hypothetical protein